MKREFRYTLWILLLCLPGMMSCNDYLDTKPSKTSSLVPTTLEHLESLLNNYDNFYQESNRTAIYSSDDFGLYTDIYKAKSNAYDIAGIEFATWDTEFLPDDTRESFWAEEYKKIFMANMVLEYLDKVAGDSERKKVLEAEAHLIKAYSYWILVNTYCLPYTDATKDELGLVLKNFVSFEEPTVRATLAETYQAIESELTGALKLQNSLEMVNNKYRTWRGSKPAAEAFAARYYLSISNYSEALKYAENALTGHDVLVDYNTDMRYSANKSEVTINVGLPNQEKVEIKYPYTHDNQSDMTDMLEWKEFYYFRMLYNSSWWYLPSKELLALYDKDYDLRYRYHVVENYSYTKGLIKPAYKWPGYVFFYEDRIPSGMTVAEMILTKAECLARQGQFQEAMNTVNVLRAKRMDVDAPANVINLVASSKEEAIRKVLEERHREMPFTMRWYDIRRFNNNEDASDDVILKREFYPYNNAIVLDGESVKTYILERNSRRYAAPIHNTEIESSLGQIKQNAY